jgi:hypothetical protein
MDVPARTTNAEPVAILTRPMVFEGWASAGIVASATPSTVMDRIAANLVDRWLIM